MTDMTLWTQDRTGWTKGDIRIEVSGRIGRYVVKIGGKWLRGPARRLRRFASFETAVKAAEQAQIL